MFSIGLKHVLRIEEEILNDSRLFSLSNTKTDFNIETIFNWNEITIEDILEIYKSTINDFYEQWMKNHICAKRSFDRQDKIQENELNEIESNLIDKRYFMKHDLKIEVRNVDMHIAVRFSRSSIKLYIGDIK